MIRSAIPTSSGATTLVRGPPCYKPKLAKSKKACMQSIVPQGEEMSGCGHRNRDLCEAGEEVPGRQLSVVWVAEP